ncbi:MAG TPA: YjgB family protein [Caproiciproducens sp.]|nr:YjgB family protein [Caproiciproducens sp.]
MLLQRKSLVFCMALILCAALPAGCSKPGNGSSAVSSGQAVSAPSSGAASSSGATASVPRGLSAPQEDAYKDLLISIQKEARQGKVIGCEFPVETKCIEDVQKAWGKEDKSEYVASAKGTYAVYNKKNMVFGFNKGSQLFEVRTFDSKLKDITLAEAEDVFGKPAHDVFSGSEEILGYVVSEKYKLLLVFASAKADGENAKLDHYSVFYPQGTVNYMADDPGREW